MDDPVILWGLAVVACAAAALPTWHLFVVHISVKAATAALRRLLEAGNRSRAIKLTHAGPRSAYLRAVRHALDTRPAADASQAAVRDEVQRRFDQELVEGMRPLRRVMPAGYLALAAGGLGAGLAGTASTTLWPPTIISVAALLVALRNLGQADALERDSRAGFAELLDPTVAAILGTPVGSEAAPASAPSSAAAPVASSGDDARSHAGGAPDVSGALALVATLDGRELARVTLDQSVIKIGRLSSSQLYLDDPSISRMHAVVEVADDQVRIIDLGSDRGTVHNGDRINKATLVAGDVLELGDVRVEVVAADAS